MVEYRMKLREYRSTTLRAYAQEMCLALSILIAIYFAIFAMTNDNDISAIYAAIFTPGPIYRRYISDIAPAGSSALRWRSLKMHSC